MIKTMQTCKYFLFAASLLLTKNNYAQNTTSPYSILGIGDIETKDFGRWYGMGSTSIALSSPYYINASNPASLMGLSERMMNFDIANRGKSARFMYPGADTLTNTTKDMSIRRISLAFKPNKRYAFSIGLKPYSTVNFLLQEYNNVYSNNSGLLKITDGSGGLNQLYFSYARQLAKNFSVGITSSYYFGSANIKTSYYGQDLSTSLVKQQYDIMNAFQFQAGVQYVMNTSGIVTHRIGITVSNPTTVKRQTAIEYLNNAVSIKSVNDTKKDFKLPLSLGIGYAMIINDDLTISADAVFNKWKKQKLEYNGSYTTPSGRISAGLEYVSRKKINNYKVENWYLQAGVSAEKNYFTVLENNLYSYGISAGFGKNLSGLISVYTGYEYGIKGNRNNNQIKEQYGQYIIGFTLKEFWFNFKKYGRYQ